MKIASNEYAHEYQLVASHCNAQQELSLPLLIRQLIDVAVEHANRLHVGYSDLLKINALWVLSRVTLKIRRMPRIEERYTLITWVETFQRIFSHRNFLMVDADGNELAWARTLWVGIDKDTRRPADLSALTEGRDFTSGRECPFAEPPKLREFTEVTDFEHYRFVASDIDFNRHVNTARYIELIVNQWSMEFYDRHYVADFDVAFKGEAHYGDKVAIRIAREGSGARLQLDGEDKCYCLANITFGER